jgi:hypothetical protein
MSQSSVMVELVGGPFDGLTLLLSPSWDDLVPTVALPVNENMFSRLDGKTTGPARPCRTVALYELRRPGERRYHFLGSRLAVELHLENWQV